jgi:hypothetical protein
MDKQLQATPEKTATSAGFVCFGVVAALLGLVILVWVIKWAWFHGPRGE